MLRFGIICEIDASKGLARVHFDDDGIVSYWLPVVYPKASQDSFSWIPDINEHVACLMDEHLENGVIIGSIYSKAKQPDGGNSDKFRVKFKDGTVIEYDRAEHKLTADVEGTVEVKATGNVKVETPASATLKAVAVTIDSPSVTVTGVLSAGQISAAPGSAGGNGNVAINGNVSVQGNISVTGGNVTADGIGLKTHKHTGVTTGSGTSAIPIP